MEIQDLIIDTRIYAYVQKYSREFIIGIAVAAGVFGSGYFYYSYRSSQEEMAQVAFSTVVQEIERAYKKPDLWPEAELAAVAGYRQHHNSAFAPYFLALHAQALIQQDRMQEALAIMNELLTKLSSSSPFYYLYKIKTALMQLDMQDSAIQAQGLQALIALSQDNKNPQQDQALYYLGAYYLNNQDKQKAIDVWKELLQLYPLAGAEYGTSPWSHTAAYKLDQLGVKQ